ncbi:hypothetical protein M9H77_21997 [Catharanthus roseus]|uniref:Uncharacterized protein n=1 Tax=Catharanthus roseus TaxID=4058 RepID=A0ACC0AQ26_CATRO|nr:hypothetical protein M9H77_21997 [Catharanthus roseus]
MEGIAAAQDSPAKGSSSLAKLSTGDIGNDRINSGWKSQAASPRMGYMHRGIGGLPRQGARSTRGFRPEMAAATSDKFRRREAKKEILRRALTPPVKRPTLRWLDFRPVPSRLCNMSMA